MERLLSCECGRQHHVTSSQAGQEIKCDCGKIVAVPTLRGLSKLPLAEATPRTEPNPYSSGASGASHPAASRVWQGWRGPAMALASAGFIIALATCGWYSWERFKIDTSYTAEKEIAAGDEMLDSYDANSLSEIWHGFGKMGLSNKEPPAFFLWNLYAEDRARRALISGGVAISFAFIALAIAYSARRQKAQLQRDRVGTS